VWGEGKPGRAALHGIVGALTGGLGGAIGSTAASMGMPILSAQIDELPISESAKQALNQIAVLALLSSNASAAAAGLNTDANNRAAHAKETALIKAKSAEFAAKLRDRGYDVTPEKAQSILSEIVDNRIDYTAAKKSDVETGNDAIKAEAQKYLNQIGKAEGTFKDESGVERQYFSNRDVQGNFNEKDFYNPALFSTIKKAEEGKFTGTISAGAYLGLGGEIELKFEQGQVTEVKGVLGAGIGAKTLAIPKQSLNDSGVGYKAEIPAFLSSGDIQPGESRIGFTAGGAIRGGPAQVGVGASLGAANNPHSGLASGYYELKPELALVPTIIGFGAEVKMGIEFTYKLMPDKLTPAPRIIGVQ